MTPEKRKKIKALMDSPASTENEKAICRKLLKDNPEPDPPIRRPDMRFVSNWQTPRSQASQNFWSRAQQAGQAQDAARRQQAAGQQRRPYNQAEEETEARAERSRQTSWDQFKGRVNSEEYQAAQQATNSFLSELARMIAKDMENGKK
jgi:hypothetical protein